MDARVISPFCWGPTGRTWRAGETFQGSESDVALLVSRGFAARPEPSTAQPLDGMTVAELRALCADRGVDVPKRARKADLIDALGGQ